MDFAWLLLVDFIFCYASERWIVDGVCNQATDLEATGTRAKPTGGREYGEASFKPEI